MSNGLLIIRLVAGLLMFGHGLQKAFGWFGGVGIKGTSAGFRRLGFHPPVLMAWMAALGEAASGVLIATGFLFPLGAAALIGVMVNAGSVHWPNGLWITKNGIELILLFAAVASGLAFIGPGEISIDHALDLELHGDGWGVAATVGGLVAGFGTLATRKRPETNPGTA